MIELKQVSVQYEHNKQIDFPDWQLAQGDLSLITGASGTGKTTLLNVLAGLLPPTKGEVKVAKQNPYSLSAAENDTFRGRNIGLIFQKPHLIPSLTVLDNLLAAQYFANLPTKKQQALHLLEELNIANKASQKPNKLSQGEQQRVAIARAMLNSPKLILADEPTSALDDANCEVVLRIITEQANKHKATLVMATHDQRIKNEIPNALTLLKKETV